MLQKNFFGILAFFGRFSTKKQLKLTKNEENWQNPNHLLKFSEIWYVDVSQQKKCYKKNATKKLFLDFGLFWPFFNQKTAKIVQKKEDWQNPYRLMTFSEIWYVDAFQQNKCYKFIYFGFRPFLTVSQPKNSQN